MAYDPPTGPYTQAILVSKQADGSFAYVSPETPLYDPSGQDLTPTTILAIGAAVVAGLLAACLLAPLNVKVIGGVQAPTGAALITTTGVIATTGQLLLAANPNRNGFYLYNNSANSVYVTYGSPPCAGTNITFILATFAQFIETTGVHYTGPLCGMHNSGSGTVTITELQ